MVFRIWSPASRDSDSAPVEHDAKQNSGVVAFIEDVVATKQGMFFYKRDQLYVSGLSRPADALVISRQVQLGLQGFRGTPGANPVAVSIAIDTSRQTAPTTSVEAIQAGEHADNPSPDSTSKDKAPEPSHDLLTLLKLSKPAQVLITHDLYQRSSAVKGLPVKSFPARFGVYEYLWTGQEKLELLQSEPQLTLVALPPVATFAAPPTKALKETAIPAESAANSSGAQDRPLKMVLPGWPAFLTRRIAIYAAAGLVAVGAIVAVGLSLAHKPPSQPAKHDSTVSNPVSSSPGPGSPAGATPDSSVPSPSAASGIQSPAGSTAGHQNTPKGAHRQVPAAEKHETSPAAPSQQCNLPGDVSRYVGLAEQARGRGDYSNAERRFREVLACEPNNAAAREGLNKAIQGEQQRRPQ